MSWGSCKKVLIMELMGKHSNIIFCDDKGMILDSIKHVSSHMSSVREVLPGREYFIPKTQDKLDPLTVSERSSVMLCAGSHVMFPRLFTLLLLESVRLLRRRSVSGLRSTGVMQRSLWMRRQGAFVSYVPQADGSGCGGGFFSEYCLPGGRTCGVWCVCVPAVWTGVSFCGV